MSRSDRGHPPRVLHVALVWNGALLDERWYSPGDAVVLGSSPSALAPLPTSGAAPDEVRVLLEAGVEGTRIHLWEGVRGGLWRDGIEESIERTSAANETVLVGPLDYGVVSVADLWVFFQWVTPAASPARRRPWPTSDFVASVGLSVFVHVALLVLAQIVGAEAPRRHHLELARDVAAKYRVVQPIDAPADDAREPSRAEPTTVERPSTAPSARRRDARPTDPAVSERVRDTALVKALRRTETRNAVAAVLALPRAEDVLARLILREAESNDSRTSPPASVSPTPAVLPTTTAEDVRRETDAREPRPRTEARPEARVRTGAPRVSGELSAQAIASVIEANAARVRYCYEAALQAQPRLAGSISVQFRIDNRGLVETARVVTSSLRNARVEGCVVRQIRGLRFPRPSSGDAVVTYPFVFGVGG